MPGGVHCLHPAAEQADSGWPQLPGNPPHSCSKALPRTFSRGGWGGLGSGVGRTQYGSLSLHCLTLAPDTCPHSGHFCKAQSPATCWLCPGCARSLQGGHPDPAPHPTGSVQKYPCLSFPDPSPSQCPSTAVLGQDSVSRSAETPGLPPAGAGLPGGGEVAVRGWDGREVAVRGWDGREVGAFLAGGAFLCV